MNTSNTPTKETFLQFCERTLEELKSGEKSGYKTEMVEKLVKEMKEGDLSDESFELSKQLHVVYVNF